MTPSSTDSVKHTGRLSAAMLTVLRNVDAGRAPGNHISGMSASGGFASTLLALRKRGLIKQESIAGLGYTCHLTEAGRAAIAKATGEKS